MGWGIRRRGSQHAGEASLPPGVHAPATRNAPPPTSMAELPPPPPPNHSKRAKLVQAFKPSKILNPPAIQLEGKWEDSVADSVCSLWIESKTRSLDNVSILALSRMEALEYERKRFKHIAPEKRILPHAKTANDYNEEIVKAFLTAVGEKDLEAVLDSFKLSGTGNLHRHQQIVLAILNNSVGAGQQFVPAPVSRAVLSGLRFALATATARESLKSAPRRLRNAQTEEISQLGLADASPSAKSGLDLREASKEARKHLRYAAAVAKEVDTARHQAELARVAYEQDPTEQNWTSMHQATEELELQYAKACFLLEVKADYRHASDLAKKELAKRNFKTNISAASLTTTATMLSIMSPYPWLGSVVTGTVSAAATAAAAFIYARYHFSDGPSKDGEDKAKKAILALGRSSDIFSSESQLADKQRVQAIRVYLEESKSQDFSSLEVESEAKTRLMATLKEISATELVTKSTPATPQQNWQNYREYLQAEQWIRDEGKTQGRTTAEIDAVLCELTERFEHAHGTDFVPQVALDAWKGPLRMRMEAGQRLLSGKIAHLKKQHMQLERKPLRTRDRLRVDAKKTQEKKAHIARELEQALSDWVNFTLASACTADIAAGDLTDKQRDVKFDDAKVALGKIQDEDFRKLFCGDATEQVTAALKSKTLTAGESDRYSLTNLANALPGIIVNTGIAGADFTVSILRAEGLWHLQFSDWKNTAPLALTSNNYQNAGTRSQLSGHLKKTREIPMDGETVLSVPFHVPDTGYVDPDDSQIKLLAQQLLEAKSIPNAVETDELVKLYLDKTEAFHDEQYETASKSVQKQVKSEKRKIVRKQVGLSMLGLPTQGRAQRSLRKADGPLVDMQTMRSAVRSTLGDVKETATPITELRERMDQLQAEYQRNWEEKFAPPKPVPLRAFRERMQREFGGKRASISSEAVQDPDSDDTSPSTWLTQPEKFDSLLNALPSMEETSLELSESTKLFLKRVQTIDPNSLEQFNESELKQAYEMLDVLRDATKEAWEELSDMNDVLLESADLPQEESPMLAEAEFSLLQAWQHLEALMQR